MEGDNHSLISIGGTGIGIIGLKTALEEVAKFKGRPDKEIQEMLLDRLKKNNYIPENVKEEYGRAFLREFKKFMGEEVEEDKGPLSIKILGPGCPRCQTLEQDVYKVLTENNTPANVEHVTDLSEMRKYGCILTPGLVINGKLKSSGQVPSKTTIKKWIEEEMDSH